MSRIILYILCYIVLLPGLSFSEVFSLKEALKKGISSHESIRASKHLESKSSYELEKAKKDRLFKVSASYSASRYDDYQYRVINGSDAVVGGEKGYSWNISLFQPVFTGFALSSAQRIAELNLENAELNTKSSTITIAWRIKAGYNNLFLAEKTLLVAEQTLKSLKAHKEDAGKFYKNGLVPYNDLLKAEVKLAEAVQNQKTAIANLKNSKALLNILIGRKSSEEIKIEALKKPSMDLYDLSSLANDALKRRPDILSLKKRLEILDHAQTIENSSNYPQISLIADYTQNGGDYDKSDSKYANKSIGIQLKWDLFNFRKTNSSVKSKIREKMSVKENLKEVEKNILLEVESVLRNLKVAEKNIVTAEKSVFQAKENFRITNIQYKKQTTTSTEVLNARTYLSNAETGYYRALYRYWSLMADLEKSVGLVF